MASHDEPLSWLKLERYALGELDVVERAEVEARLAVSEEDRACLAQIQADQSELPPLPRVSAPRLRQDTPRTAPPSKARWIAWTGGLCAAAALLLLSVREQRTTLGETAPVAGRGIKGAEVALKLISDRQGPNPRTFSTGERFKLEVTCPPGLGASLRVWVFQAGEAFAPLPTSAPLPCGNLVPWPGAFSLDGTEPADVCVSWGTPEARIQQPGDLGNSSVCRRLEPR